MTRRHGNDERPCALTNSNKSEFDLAEFEKQKLACFSCYLDRGLVSRGRLEPPQIWTNVKIHVGGFY